MRDAPKVWGFLVRGYVSACEACGGDVERALEGITTLEALATPGARIPWSSLARILGRFHDELGDEGMAKAGGVHIRVVPAFQFLAGALGSPTAWYRAVLAPVPHLWPMLEVRRNEVVGETYYGDVRIAEPWAASAPYFWGTLGMLRAMPLVFGYGEAPVEHVIGERDARFEARFGVSALQEPMPTVTRLRVDASTALLELIGSLGPRVGGSVFATVLEAAQAGTSRSRVLRLQERLGLTHTEARVAARLADGLRVDDVAFELGTTESTARTHLRNIFRKLRVSRQAELVALVHRVR